MNHGGSTPCARRGRGRERDKRRTSTGRCAIGVRHMARSSSRFTAVVAVGALVLALHNLSSFWTFQLEARLRGRGRDGAGRTAATARPAAGRRRGEAVVVPTKTAVGAAPPPPPAMPLPPDDIKDPYDSFSSCLLWMDDNFRLPEWIAYHYYMMNLRYLVIHTDPKSKTTPHAALERWRDRIKIIVWDNVTIFSNKTYDYYPTDAEVDGTPIDRVIRRRSGLYVERQVDFFKGCAMHLKAEGRKWVSFHDSDEFIVVRPWAKVPIDDIDKPGVLARIVNRYARNDLNSGNTTRKTAIDDMLLQDWHSWFSSRPCVVLPRALFSAINSSDEDVSKGVPSFLDARQFETFAWRYQGTRMSNRDGPGKAIIDVSRLPDDAATSQAVGRRTPHRPFGDYCTHADRTANSLPLLIHHYLGSWEAFSYRDDVRKGLARSIEKWQDQSTWNDGGINDEARVWIRGFVSMVGVETAKELLKDAGLPPGTKKSANETHEWKLKGTDAWKKGGRRATNE